VTDLLIFGYGNPGRGDDALGPLMLQHLETLKKRHAWDRIELLGDYQLQVEHALDLLNRRLVLFIDASVSCAAPYCFERLQEKRDESYTSHAMSPAAVLYTYRQLYHCAPPPTYLLSVLGERFELGESLSPSAVAHMQRALRLLERVCRQAQLGQGSAYCERLTQAPEYE
jgi:hydrogenase maturation protease